MDPEAARDSLELVFHMSNILETGLDRQTLSILIALCEMGLNPEPLVAVVKELRREPLPLHPYRLQHHLLNEKGSKRRGEVESYWNVQACDYSF